jgi:hypothetical protein
VPTLNSLQKRIFAKLRPVALPAHLERHAPFATLHRLKNGMDRSLAPALRANAPAIRLPETRVGGISPSRPELELLTRRRQSKLPPLLRALPAR